MRKVSRLAALILALCASVAESSTATAKDYVSRTTQTGFTLPGVRSPSGNDEVRAADGTTCRTSLGHRGAYVDIGGVASEDEGRFGNASVYGRLIIPVGKQPRRIDCDDLYQLEIQRLRMEVEAMRRSFENGDDKGAFALAKGAVPSPAAAEAEFDRAFGYAGYNDTASSGSTVGTTASIAADTAPPAAVVAAEPTVPARTETASVATVPPRAGVADRDAFTGGVAGDPGAATVPNMTAVSGVATVPDGATVPDVSADRRFDVPTATEQALLERGADEPPLAVVGPLPEPWGLPYAAPAPKVRPETLTRAALLPPRPMAPARNVVVTAMPEATVPARALTPASTVRPAPMMAPPATVPERPRVEAPPAAAPVQRLPLPVPTMPEGDLRGFDRPGTTAIAIDADPYEWPFPSPPIDPVSTQSITVTQTTLDDLEIIARTRAASRLPMTVPPRDGSASDWTRNFVAPHASVPRASVPKRATAPSHQGGLIDFPGL